MCCLTELVRTTRRLGTSAQPEQHALPLHQPSQLTRCEKNEHGPFFRRSGGGTLGNGTRPRSERKHMHYPTAEHTSIVSHIGVPEGSESDSGVLAALPFARRAVSEAASRSIWSMILPHVARSCCCTHTIARAHARDTARHTGCPRGGEKTQGEES